MMPLTSADQAITFHLEDDPPDKPILQLGPKGEIRIRGKLVERDREVVNAMRHFLTGGGITSASIMYRGGDQ